ncbi:MAG: hypothetical protein E7170_03675 [Firmicutes bacterium]|nr:hypothetical protein [Bacillota bacterium]
MRELCLILDTEGKYRIVLESGNLEEIDEYTSKKFSNSTDIRNKYKKQIDEFLKQYENQIKNSKNPNYKGRIALVLPEKVGSKIEDYQRSVLYRKHIIVFNQLIRNEEAMNAFAYYEKNKEDKIVSDFICDMIRKPWNRRNGNRQHINEWLRTIKKQPNIYYQVVRDLLMTYNELTNKKPYLKSIDNIYDDYIKEEERKIQERLALKGQLKLQTDTQHEVVEDNEIMYQINGSKWNVDELTLFDLDEIDETSEYIPDALRKEFKK